jgi:2-dehydro-3-deoxygluconokinase
LSGEEHAGPVLAVIGNSVLDMFMLGLDGFPRREGERAQVRQIEYQPGGNALNVAIGVALISPTRVKLLSAIGRGPDSRLPRAACRDARLLGSIQTINANNDPARHGDLSVIALARGNARFLLHTGCSATIDVDFLQAHARTIARSDMLHLCSIGGLPGLDLGKLADFLGQVRAANPNLKISLDVILTSGQSELAAGILSLLPHVDIFMPNEPEARQYGDESLIKAAAKFNRHVRVATIITRGEKGVLLCERGKREIVVPTKRVPQAKIIDTVGAGDAWASGFLCNYMRGRPLVECCRRGNAIAAQSLTCHGGTAGIRSSQAAKHQVHGV